jgi:hypothetical protein
MTELATPLLRNIRWLDLFWLGSRHSDAVSFISLTKFCKIKLKGKVTHQL